MRHFTHFSDLGVAGLERVLDQALAWKGSPPRGRLENRVLGMIFFNPSLRTRVSFETVMLRSGGHAVVLEVGAGVWAFETETGAVMDGSRAEHIREAIPVLGRYVDALAVRGFAALEDDDADAADELIKRFRDLAGVPVVSMESAREHPCQGLADLLTIREHYGDPRNLPVTLTWAPHIKPLPKAVPHSFLLTAAAAGCDVRIACPSGFDLHPGVLEEASGYAVQSGGAIRVFHDQEEALVDSRVVYAKSWGPASSPAVAQDSPASRSPAAYRDWIVDQSKLDRAAEKALFMHCLPVRRNVEVADEVLDGPASYVVEEAENRFHVQRVVLDALLNPKAW